MDCGNDAHKHVANCKEGGGKVFIDYQGFINISNGRRKKRIQDFFLNNIQQSVNIQKEVKDQIMNGLKIFLIPHLKPFNIQL